MKQKAVIITMLMLFVAVSILASGCGSPGMTYKEEHRRHINTFKNDVWQFQDDLDAFLMIDRPSRLAPMYVR